MRSEQEQPDAEGEAARQLPLVGQPVARTEKWIKKRKLSERSEFFRFPFFGAWQREPSAGGLALRGEFFAYFLTVKK